jgi:hypothetical protein
LEGIKITDGQSPSAGPLARGKRPLGLLGKFHWQGSSRPIRTCTYVAYYEGEKIKKGTVIVPCYTTAAPCKRKKTVDGNDEFWGATAFPDGKPWGLLKRARLRRNGLVPRRESPIKGPRSNLRQTSGATRSPLRRTLGNPGLGITLNQMSFHTCISSKDSLDCCWRMS